MRALGGRTAAAIILGCVVAGQAWGQGQDSATATMGPQTSGHPVPLLSTASVTSVPSGKMIDGLPMPASLRRDGQIAGLTLPGQVPLAAPAQLHCEDIADPTARSRCEARKAPPAPPAGAGQ